MILVATYIFIVVSIVVFFLPFYFLHLRRVGKNIRPLANWSLELENFFSSQEAAYLMFFWAMGEALIWYVIPEFLLLLIIFMRTRNKIKLLSYDIAGTIVGTLLAQGISRLIFLTPQELSGFPFLTPVMVRQVNIWYVDLGLLALMFQPLSGIPYKVFTLSVYQHNANWLLFLALAVAVRAGRYYLTFLVFSGLYAVLHRFVFRNYVWLFFLACLIFTLALRHVLGVYGADYEGYYDHRKFLGMITSPANPFFVAVV